MPYLFGKHPGWAARFESLKALKWMFPTLKTGNFPFGSAAASCCPRADKRQIIAGLPPRAIVELLVHGYLSTVERTHRLLHGPQFLWQLDRFFADPMAVPDGWLAMLLMMMAIACRVAPLPSQEVASEMLRAEWQRWKEDQEPVQGLGSCGPHSSLASGAAVDTATHSPHRVDLRSMAIHQWTDRFLDDAEACLARSPWLTAPDITTVQTLAMMALARQLELVTHNDTFQCYVVLGLAVRVATALQFHRSASRLFPGMPKFEAEMRSRVWTTIVLLDLDVALASGMSSVPYDYDADPPMNVNDSEIAPDGLPSSLDIGGRIEMHVPRGSPPPERGPIRRRRPAGVAQSTSSASVDKDDASRADSGLQSSSTQQQGQGASSRYTEGTFQSLLAPLLRRAAAVVNAVNSVRAAHAVPYSRVMAWDAELRSLLVDAALAFNMRYGDLPGIDQTEQHAGCRIGFGTVCTRTRCERVAAQLGIFEVLVRRTLLALHHPYARSRSTTTTEREMTTKRAKRYARSRAAVLESSMALLAVQQLWSEAATSAMMGIGGSGTSTMADNSRVGWLLDLCKDDFKTAMIYVILGLRRSEFPCDDNAAVSLNPGAASPQSPPSASPSATSSTSWPSSSSSVVVSARDSARNAASTRATSLASSPAANGTSSAASASASFARHQTGRSTRATTEGIMERSTKQGEDQQKTNPLSTLPTVSAARAALASGISIMRRRACRSFTHFREYTGVSILLQVLACVEEEREERQNSRLGNELQNQETAQVQRGPGCCVPSCTSFARLLPSDETRVLPAMLALADEIEAVVVQGRKGLWDAAAPVPAADTSLSPQPLPAEMMMGSCGGLSDEPAQMHNLFGRQLEQEQQQPDATWLSDSNMMVIDDDFFEYLF